MIAEVLNNFFKKSATTKYPAEKLEMPESFRGKLRFYSDRCIGCKLCMRDCPTAAIVINTLTPSAAPVASQPVPASSSLPTTAASVPPTPAPPPKKQFEAAIDNSKCIFCAQCVDVCPKKALEATKDVELAQFDIDKLKVVFHAQPPQPSKPPAPQVSPEKPA
jgi:formate hydrogenlyase subunit 6/NADH:ubiquinone oxidoreductase subunit I